MCPRFGRLMNADPILNFLEGHAHMIGHVRAWHCLRSVPETVPTAKIKVSIRSGGGSFFQLGKQVRFARRRQSHDTRCVDQIFELYKLVLKYLRCFALEVAHLSLSS